MHGYLNTQEKKVVAAYRSLDVVPALFFFCWHKCIFRKYRNGVSQTLLSAFLARFYELQNTSPYVMEMRRGGSVCGLKLGEQTRVLHLLGSCAVGECCHPRTGNALLA